MLRRRLRRRHIISRACIRLFIPGSYGYAYLSLPSFLPRRSTRKERQENLWNTATIRRESPRNLQASSDPRLPYSRRSLGFRSCRTSPGLCVASPRTPFPGESKCSGSTPKMTCPDGEAEQQWIQNVKSGGAVPCLAPENCPKGWATPPGDSFMVRGPGYLTNKVKIPGGEYLLKPLGFDWIRGPIKICEVLNDKNHRVRKAIDEEVSHGNQPFVWAFNLQLPKDNYSAIFYFVSLEPIPEGSLMDQFLKGDDAFRKSRLKLIANTVKGPWIVRTAVGEQAICILGRALSCKYIQGSNFIEIDVDIGSSIVANAIVHLAFGYVTTLTVDLAFLIESQTESELPERLLGAVRFSELNPGSVGLYQKPPSEEHQESSQIPSTGFWRGFSQLLHNPGNPREPSPSSQNTNGNLQTEDSNENK